jgi:FkbM family methyltransferase
MKNLLRRGKSRLRRLLGFPVANSPPENAVTRELRRVFADLDDAFCVQVGSNDGIQGDPLHALFKERPGWRALFVEPVPALFARLRASYPDAGRFSFANVAISDRDAAMKFYSVTEDARSQLGDSLPYWFDQLGSFNREHILRHLDGRLEPYVVEIDVKAVTLDKLLREHGVERVDLLHSDTEGHDLIVISGLDFSRFSPRAILYEHRHLSADDQKKALALLEAHGYVSTEFEGDTLAVLTGPIPRDN